MNHTMDQEVAGAPSSSPPFSGLCPASIESLLNALFPDDDTLANHLSYPDTMATNGVGNFGDHGMMMDSRYANNHFMDIGGFDDQLLSASYSPHQYYNNNQGYDTFQANTIADTLDQLLASSFTAISPVNSSSCSYSSNHTSPLTTSPPSSSYSPSTSQPSSYQLASNFPQSWPASLRRPYTDAQSNHLLPLDNGFKPVIKLNTPHSKTNEPWRASVAKKILEAYYSPISLKSEFLATQSALDEFQSLALKEAVAAFHDVALNNSASVTSVCANKFVITCDKVRAYRRLFIEDKVTLLTNVFYDTLAMKSVITYDHLTDSWTCSGRRIDRREIYQMDPELHDGLVHIIETYPDRWRNDLTAAAIIYLIVIFNPELPDLKFSDSVRLEQYGYIYLLKRYLEAACESPCDASDYHYRLMCKIEEIQSLRQNMTTLLDSINTGIVPPFKSLISTLIK